MIDAVRSSRVDRRVRLIGSIRVRVRTRLKARISRHARSLLLGRLPLHQSADQYRVDAFGLHQLDDALSIDLTFTRQYRVQSRGVDTAFAELSDPFILECGGSVVSWCDCYDQRLPDRGGRSSLVMPNLVYRSARDACCEYCEASSRCQPRIQTSLHCGLREPHDVETDEVDQIVAPPAAGRIPIATKQARLECGWYVRLMLGYQACGGSVPSTYDTRAELTLERMF